jgi:hypothetical protein
MSTSTAFSRYWLVLPMVLVIAGTSPATATTTAPSAELQAQPRAPEELVPPPPPNCGMVTWLPGHWRWTGIAGIEWQWERGRYVEWPPGPTASVIDQGQSAPDGWVRSDDEGQ